MPYLLKNKLLILIIAPLLLLSSCGYKAITMQTQDVAFLKFNIPTSQNYIVTVNNKYTFRLDKCIKNEEVGNCDSSNKDILYEVGSGKLLIVVTDDNGNLIMERDMYVGSGNTKVVTW